MDDGKRENNKVKQTKTDIVKSTLSLYLQKRQIVNIKPRTINKKTAIKRAVVDSRIRRPGSVLDTFISDCNPLQVEYSFMFQKFVSWLQYQINWKQQCYDIEKLVGPLFCHFFIDLRCSGKPQDAISSSNFFFKSHIEKIDQEKCDETVLNILNAVSQVPDNSELNGTEESKFDELKDKFRASKVVVYITPQSLLLLQKFVGENSNIESRILLLQALQTWFDLRVKPQNDCCVSVEEFKEYNKYLFSLPKNQALKSTDQIKLKEDELRLWFEVKAQSNDDDFFKTFQLDENRYEFLTGLTPEDKKFQQNREKNKLKALIKKTQKLPAMVCNIRILNTKRFVNCGFIKSQANLVAFAEHNMLKIMPLQVVVDTVCDVEDLNYIRFIHHSKQIYSIALSPDNNIICTGSADHTICMYNLKSITFLKRLFGHLGPVYCLAVSPNSKYLASGSQDGTCRLWNLNSGKALRVLAGHVEAVTCLSFHPNSLYLATGSADRNVRIWTINDANTVRLLHAAKREVYSVAFSPTGQYVASASDDKKVRIWDVNTCKVFHEYKNRESSVFHLLWNKNGKRLCGGTASGVVKIWEFRDKEANKHSKDHKHSDPVIRRRSYGRLLCLDNSVGNFTCLSIPKSERV